MATLYDLHAAAVYSISLRILQDRNSAENVLQEVFLEVWRSPAKFFPMKSNLQGWLVFEARNRAVNLLRARRTKHPIDASQLRPTETLSPHCCDHLTSGHLRTAIAKISCDEREVFMLAFLEGLTLAEIAEEKNIPHSNVKTMLGSTLRFLRDSLKD